MATLGIAWRTLLQPVVDLEEDSDRVAVPAVVVVDVVAAVVVAVDAAARKTRRNGCR